MLMKHQAGILGLLFWIIIINTYKILLWIFSLLIMILYYCFILLLHCFIGLHPMASKEIMNDPLLLSQLLAIQKPFWETKLNKQGYHAITRSLYVAELIRKVDGRNMDLFVKEEITKPLGIDFSFNRSSSSSSVISDDEADYEPKIAPCFAPASSLVVYLFLTLHLILPNFLINLVFSNTTRMSTADISRFRLFNYYYIIIC